MPTQEEYEDLIVRLDTKMDTVQSTMSEIAEHVGKIDGSLKQVCTTVYGHNSDKGLCGVVETQGEDLKRHMKIIYAILGVLSVGGGTAIVVEKLFG